MSSLQDIIRSVTGYQNLELYDAESKIKEYEEWYKGYAPKFHNYKVFNGKKQVDFRRYSLQMGKKVCEDWANLLINEKTDIVLDDVTSQENLWQILEKCKFWQKANEGIEKTFALGGGALVLSVDNLSVLEDGTIGKDGKINVTFVNAKKMRPITIEDGVITECAFISVNSKTTNVVVHLKDENGNYVIHNFVADGNDETNLKVRENTYYQFNTRSPLRWFVTLKPNIANNIDIDSPLGISIFANAIDVLKSIDVVYDSYVNEFIIGRKRIFINARSTTINPSTGEMQDTFDANDVAIYVLPESDDGSVFMQDSTQTLRVTEHENALQNQLNLLSYACGFGTQHYKFEQGGIATATQIISENSDMFRNIRKHEILIEDVLIELVKTIIYASNTFTAIQLKEGSNIEIRFDDSIIEDKVAEKTNDRLDVSMGVMSKAEFRAKWYNEDLETAQEKIDEMDTMSIVDNSTDVEISPTTDESTEG